MHKNIVQNSQTERINVSYFAKSYQRPGSKEYSWLFFVFFRDGLSKNQLSWLTYNYHFHDKKPILLLPKFHYLFSRKGASHFLSNGNICFFLILSDVRWSRSALAFMMLIWNPPCCRYSSRMGPSIHSLHSWIYFGKSLKLPRSVSHLESKNLREIVNGGDN